MTELWFYVPLDTKQVISEMFYRANPLAWYGKETKANTTKARIHQSKEMYYEINTKKLKPCLVAFYDIWSGNRVRLFSKEKISKGRDKKR